MTNLLDEVPKQAESAIRHAIEVSKRGRNVALKTLKKIQQGKLPVPEEAGPPKGAGPPGKRR